MKRTSEENEGDEEKERKNKDEEDSWSWPKLATIIEIHSSISKAPR